MNKSLIELSKELEEKNKLLEKLASTDSLTGIYNRRFFVELAKKELYEIKRYNKTDTLLILDVDNFKQINDEYGHMYGDKALKAFSKVCSSEIRGGDIFGRIGGEEFAIILTNTSINNAVTFAERLRNLVSKIEIEVQNKKFSLTISIGITNILPDESIYKVMSMADKALYEAKGKGRNRVEILER
ncbi:GGDEF domain-containing protein [Clostridium ganghwense]|uniref:GGDEF domain-containing protein n=1 Tax=Clostridium ganghwense TaxID=312089 RepID=A0ABT4CUP1_9CLOT|nr:GGDEF domain-containing protein [Clostridium ganghwense]MCY6371669.1 GGDEF domain-containing protein [Clostridium ganghwense]